jgi:hypothetical protein
MPSEKAAEKPIRDHKKGIMNRETENLKSVNNKKPNVNMVVGQGKPNVGDDG